MRNTHSTRKCGRKPSGDNHPFTAVALGLLFLMVVPGCVDTAARQQVLDGSSSLKSGDYDGALQRADTYLQKYPNGPDAAEAYYLRGRAYEQRAQEPRYSPTPAQARANFAAAREAYNRGLALRPPPVVQADLHAQIANIAYYEEDYNTAAREWQTAYQNAQPDTVKAPILYRIGLCQQRLGRFNEADRSFAIVRQQYPDTEAAGKAGSRMGARAFYVQVGVFADVTNAEKAAIALRQQGFATSRAVDAGRQIVRVGPMATYAEARDTKTRLGALYPGAIIQP
ncbi:MAG: Pseudouridine synthase [Phycisphaerales bacterium]|nr:Pseudouridine synthase [Phycisphaerales bacterium]